MSIERVAQVEAELGFTPADADILQGVRLVWQKLQQARLKAVKDDKFLVSYRELLERSVGQARRQQPVDDVEAEARLFWAWYEGFAVELNIPAKESARGLDHLSWCGKWLPIPFQSFQDALARLVEMPSRQNFDAAKAKATALLKAYASAV